MWKQSPSKKMSNISLLCFSFLHATVCHSKLTSPHNSFKEKPSSMPHARAASQLCSPSVRRGRTRWMAAALFPPDKNGAIFFFFFLSPLAVFVNTAHPQVCTTLVSDQSVYSSLECGHLGSRERETPHSFCRAHIGGQGFSAVVRQPLSDVPPGESDELRCGA